MATNTEILAKANALINKFEEKEAAIDAKIAIKETQVESMIAAKEAAVDAFIASGRSIDNKWGFISRTVESATFALSAPHLAVTQDIVLFDMWRSGHWGNHWHATITIRLYSPSGGRTVLSVNSTGVVTVLEGNNTLFVISTEVTAGTGTHNGQPTSRVRVRATISPYWQAEVQVEFVSVYATNKNFYRGNDVTNLDSLSITSDDASDRIFPSGVIFHTLTESVVKEGM